VKSVLGEAGFRREAAHALSTPLGALLLNAELIDHYLGKHKPAEARDAVGMLLRDFETFGQRFRAVFSAMADMAEDGPGESDPRACLSVALAELGEGGTYIGYQGMSPRVKVSGPALAALMRRLAMLAGASGAGEAMLEGTEVDGACRLSLTAEDVVDAASGDTSFDSPRTLHLRVAAEIAARHGGRMDPEPARGIMVVVTLPLSSDPVITES
jgi:hypothetical protein